MDGVPRRVLTVFALVWAASACVETEVVREPMVVSSRPPELAPVTAAPSPVKPTKTAPEVHVHYEDDWFGSATLLGVDAKTQRAVVRLQAQGPDRIAIDVIDIAKGTRVERWEATPENAKAGVQQTWFGPLTGTFEADAARFAALLKELGPWHMRPALASPTFAVSPRRGHVLFGAAPTDGSQGDWLFAFKSGSGTSRRVDQGLIASYSPVFGPDGESIAFRGCSSSPCDYGLFIAKVGDDRPKRATGIVQATPPVWNANGDAVLTVGSRAQERCLFRVGVTPIMSVPNPLECVRGLEDVNFSQDPDGRTAVLAGARGRAGAQIVELVWVLLADGSVIGTHSVERAVGTSVLSATGLLAMPMQKGAVGVVDMVTGTSHVVPENEGWFFGFEGARWLEDRLVLLRKVGDKRGYQIVTVDVRAMTSRDKWM
jgi:hypothetical protein